MKNIFRALCVIVSFTAFGCGGNVEYTRDQPAAAPACGVPSDGTADPGVNMCTPGTAIWCPCMGGGDGFQVCLANGTYGQCSRGPVPSSGSSGSSSASAESSAAGSSGASGSSAAAGQMNAAGSGSGTVPPVCSPGQQITCACPGTSVTGVQDCKSDGSGFGECFGCPMVGAAGASGSGGTLSAAGAAGKGGANVAGSGGSSVAGAGGNSGVGGMAGSSEVGGAGGTTGNGGSVTCPSLHGVMSPGEDSPPSTIITPGLKLGNAGDVGTDLMNVLLGTSVYDPDYNLIGATVCQIDPNGDVTDFERVSITWASTEIIAADKPDGNCWKLISVGGSTPSGLGLDWLSVKVATPVSSTVANGAWHGVPRSGHTPVLQVKDATFAKTDGSCVTTTTGPGLATAQMVLRASQPYVTVKPLVTSTLVNGTQDLFSFQVAADPAGPIAMKQWQVWFTKAGAYTITDITIVEDGTQLGATDAIENVIDAQVTDNGKDIMPDMPLGNVVVVFSKERTIGTNGRTYTIRGNVVGAVPGNDFSMSIGGPFEASDTVVATSCLMAGSSDPTTPIYDVTSDPNNIIGVSFLWSDRSEGATHNDLSCDKSGSSDWTHEYMVRGLPIGQSLLM